MKIESIMPTGHGHYEVTVIYRGEYLSAITSNMPLIDKYKSGERGWKTAKNQLYDYVVYKNKF